QTQGRTAGRIRHLPDEQPALRAEISALPAGQGGTAAGNRTNLARSRRGRAMNAQASFTLQGRNPDVLTCIANLSNDEVFTPPEFANRMLDTLAEVWAADHGGADLWADPEVKFLDPVAKSGVFLREIASRLTEGLKEKI